MKKWIVTWEKDGDERTEEIEASDLNSAGALAVSFVTEKQGVLLTVILADVTLAEDPTKMQSPDGTWWELGVSDTGKPVFTPVE